MKYTVLIFGITMWSVACQSPPVNTLNNEASITSADELPENPLLENVLTSITDPVDSTMSTLYGNTTAYMYAFLHNDGKYPPNSVLYHVTWKQKPDSDWFGANVPKEIVSVERVDFSDSLRPEYKLYKGHPLKHFKTVPDEARIAFLISQKMAASPPGSF